MIESLFAIALLLGLAVIGYSAGRALLRRLSWHGRLEQAVFALPLGLGTLGYVVLGIGVGRGLKALPILLGVLFLAALVGLNKRFLANASIVVSDAPSWLPKVVSVVLAVCGLCTLIAALAPPAGLEWDSLAYHLAAPKRYLELGRIYYIPDDHHTNFPFLIEMLFMAMLSLGSVAGAKLVHWLCGALLVLAIYQFGRRHFTPSVGLVAALIFGTTPIVLWEATTAYVDLGTTLFTFLSIYALVNAADAAESKLPSVPWLVVSALMMGFALGTKGTGILFWGIGLCGVLGWNLVVHRRWAKETLPHAILWGAIALALGVPWYLRSFLYTGDPLYPFGWALFHGRYWNAELAAQYAAEQARFGLGRDAISLLTAPWNLTVEPSLITQEHVAKTGHRFVFTEYWWLGLSPVYVGLVVAMPLMASKLDRKVGYLLLWGCGVGLTWFLTMHQTRYLLIGLPAFALAGAWGLWQAGKLVRLGGGALIGASALWAVVLASVGSPPFDGLALTTYKVALGLESSDEYLEADKRIGSLAQASRWINKNAPKTLKVALLDEVRGFYLDRPYVWAQPDHSTLFPWDSYADVDAWLADFKQRGYTCLLWNEPPQQPDERRWRKLLAEAIETNKLDEIQRFGRVRLLRIR